MMLWFFAIICLAIIVFVAVIAAGWGGSMPEVYDDRPDSRVQADRPLGAADLVHVRFSSSLRGYRMSEVDTLLDRLAQEMAQREAAMRDRAATPVTAPQATAPLPTAPQASFPPASDPEAGAAEGSADESTTELPPGRTDRNQA